MSKHLRSVVHKVEKLLPQKVSSVLFGNRELLKAQDITITQQREEMEKLQERNNEWEREVRALRHEDEKMYIVLPVSKQDLQKAIIPLKNKVRRAVAGSEPGVNTISWIIPPMGPVSGGHTTIFRTIQGLERNGFKCKVYVYDPQNTTSLEAIKQTLSTYPKINAEIVYNEKTIESCSALFATNWYTAYPAYNSNATTNKFYFIQDFEPLFDVAGSYSTLADNTYKFGFHGITLGSWMKNKLETEYDMQCNNFDLRVNKQEYSLANTSPRQKVVFYARPVTPRRGFELGVLALEIFHKKHPNVEIHMVGWDVSRYDIPFEYINHGIINTEELNQLYNECAAGLVLSFTNMSLLPLEMMAAGCIPVVNDAKHTRDVGYAKYIDYVLPTPSQLADGLYAATQKSDMDGYVREMSEYTKSFSWGDFDDRLAEIVANKINNN